MEFKYKDLDFVNDERLIYDINGNLRMNNPDEHFIYETNYKGETCVRLYKKAPFNIEYVKLILSFASIGLWNNEIINPDNLLKYEKECLEFQNIFYIGVCPTEDYVQILLDNSK